MHRNYTIRSVLQMNAAIFNTPYKTQDSTMNLESTLCPFSHSISPTLEVTTTVISTTID